MSNVRSTLSICTAEDAAIETHPFDRAYADANQRAAEDTYKLARLGFSVRLFFAAKPPATTAPAATAYVPAPAGMPAE